MGGGERVDGGELDRPSVWALYFTRIRGARRAHLA
jgi:hypothetical protein